MKVARISDACTNSPRQTARLIYKSRAIDCLLEKDRDECTDKNNDTSDLLLQHII